MRLRVWVRLRVRLRLWVRLRLRLWVRLRVAAELRLQAATAAAAAHGNSMLDIFWGRRVARVQKLSIHASGK